MKKKTNVRTPKQYGVAFNSDVQEMIKKHQVKEQASGSCTFAGWGD